MIIDSLIKKILNEATSDSNGARGSYVVPLRPGLKEFDKSQLKPFDIPVSKYNNPQLAYDSYDGEMKTQKKEIKNLENKTKKQPVQNTNKLDEWILITDNVIDEGTSSVVSGEYTGPVELGLKKWKPQHLGPFKKFVDTEINHNKKQKTLKNNIKRIVGVWEKNADGSYDDYEHDVHTINEDLAVWFGKKKKPKGSSQPKGPWVDICRKVNGKHPPCGRSDADKGSYPKCRAAGVAGKMTDSEKKSACQQKRKAEKKDPQRGKGQKPVMVSHKKKTNENMEKNIITLTENDLYRIVKRVLKEQTAPIPADAKLNLFCKNTNKDTSFREEGLVYNQEKDVPNGVKRLFLTRTGSSALDKVSGDVNEAGTFILDITPVSIIGNKFAGEFDASADNIVLISFSGKIQGLPYFCTIDSGTNQAWADYLNKF